MIVMGIDTGVTDTNPTGYVIFDNDSERVIGQGILIPRGKDRPARVQFLYQALHRIVAQSPRYIQAIAVETPWLGKNVQTTIVLAYVVGAVMSVASSLGVKCLEIEPSEAKRALTGKGNAGKDTMLSAAIALYGMPDSTPIHVADALGNSLAGIIKLREQELAKAA